MSGNSPPKADPPFTEEEDALMAGIRANLAKLEEAVSSAASPLATPKLNRAAPPALDESSSKKSPPPKVMAIEPAK